MRTVQRVVALAALGASLSAGFSPGLALSALAAPRLSLVAKDFTASRILVGPPYADQVLGRVAPDATLTVNILIEDIDDPTAQNGQVDITVDLSEVASKVDVVGLTQGCDQPTVDTIACHIQLPDVPPPVAVPTEAIQLRAAAGSPVGSAGSIYLSWALNGASAPTMATIDVQIIPGQTSTTPPTTNPPPTTATTHPTTPAVIRPRPTRTTLPPSPSASSSPTPAVTMTPDPTPPANPGGDGPIAIPEPAAVPFATPPGDTPAWRSPALILSLGTAAAGLLIALGYAIISLRKAAKD